MIPPHIYSQLGPVPVSIVDKIKGDAHAWGMFWYGKREISLHKDQSAAALLATFGHEMVHVALYDAGMENGLTKESLEAICDAVGTYLAAAVLAGYVTFTAPE